jgi:hypothetical protein
MNTTTVPRRRTRGEPPAPTPLDEVLSVQSLDLAPWVRQQIKQLRLKGTPVRGWTPPTVRLTDAGDVVE